VSIVTVILQDKWVSADAILAMKEAVAQSMGVPVDTIEVNYGDQLCESAPTLSPTRIPGRVRRNLLLESNLLPSSAPYPSAFSSDSKMGMVHRRIQEDETSQSRQLQFSVVLQLTELRSTVAVDNAIAATKDRVSSAVFTGSFCRELVTSSRVHNVTFLMTPSGIGAIGEVCNKTNAPPTFGLATFAEVRTQPSSMPTDQPTSKPSVHITPIQPSLATTSFIGFLVIVVLIGLLRFYAEMMGVFMVKKPQSYGHRYDILVVLNDNQEAVLENIRHEDITFYRMTQTKELENPTKDWIMNSSNKVLETRIEVKFFDKYDLLTSLNVDGHEITPNAEKLPAAVAVQIGMIVRVKLAKVKNMKDIESESGRSGLTSTPGEKIRYSAGRLNKILVRGISPLSSTSDDLYSSRPTSQLKPSHIRLSGLAHTKMSRNHRVYLNSLEDPEQKDDNLDAINYDEQIETPLSQKIRGGVYQKNSPFCDDSPRSWGEISEVMLDDNVPEEKEKDDDVDEEKNDDYSVDDDELSEVGLSHGSGLDEDDSDSMQSGDGPEKTEDEEKAEADTDHDQMNARMFAKSRISGTWKDLHPQQSSDENSDSTISNDDVAEEKENDDDDEEEKSDDGQIGEGTISWNDSMLPQRYGDFVHSFHDYSEGVIPDSYPNPLDPYSLKYEEYRKSSKHKDKSMAVTIPELNLNASFSLDDMSQKGLSMDEWSKYEEKS